MSRAPCELVSLGTTNRRDRGHVQRVRPGAASLVHAARDAALDDVRAGTDAGAIQELADPLGVVIENDLACQMFSSCLIRSESVMATLSNWGVAPGAAPVVMRSPARRTR